MYSIKDFENQSDDGSLGTFQGNAGQKTDFIKMAKKNGPRGNYRHRTLHDQISQ